MSSPTFSILGQVLTNPKVILTAVAVFLYIDIVCAVVRYRKKKKPIVPKKSFAPPPETTEEASAEGGEEDE